MGVRVCALRLALFCLSTFLFFTIFDYSVVVCLRTPRPRHKESETFSPMCIPKMLQLTLFILLYIYIYGLLVWISFLVRLFHEQINNIV